MRIVTVRPAVGTDEDEPVLLPAAGADAQVVLWPDPVADWAEYEGPDETPLLLELELAEPSMFLPYAPPQAVSTSQRRSWRRRATRRDSRVRRTGHIGPTQKSVSSSPPTASAQNALAVRWLGLQYGVGFYEVVTSTCARAQTHDREVLLETSGVAEWERVAMKGWPPTETAALGEWTLRAAGGFTPEANSVLAVGDPGMPPEQALLVAADWYADRGLPLVVLTPVGDAVDVALTGLNWSVEGPILGRTASVGQALATVNGAMRQKAKQVLLHESLPDGWLAFLADGSQERYSSGQAMSSVGRQILGNVGGEGQVRFAQVASDVVHAIARGVLVDDVLLLGLMEVATSYRGRALGMIVTLALLGWAAESNAELALLRVIRNNMASVRISDKLGFTTCYTSNYRRPPVLIG